MNVIELLLVKIPQDNNLKTKEINDTKRYLLIIIRNMCKVSYMVNNYFNSTNKSISDK